MKYTEKTEAWFLKITVMYLQLIKNFQNTETGEGEGSG